MDHLITLLLPLTDKAGAPFPDTLLTEVRRELADLFGGLTAFSRSPAEGVWKAEDRTARDDVVALEIMTTELDRDWWATYRRGLETRFDQDEIVIRAHAFERI